MWYSGLPVVQKLRWFGTCPESQPPVVTVATMQIFITHKLFNWGCMSLIWLYVFKQDSFSFYKSIIFPPVLWSWAITWIFLFLPLENALKRWQMCPWDHLKWLSEINLHKIGRWNYFFFSGNSSSQTTWSHYEGALSKSGSDNSE